MKKVLIAIAAVGMTFVASLTPAQAFDAKTFWEEQAKSAH